MARLRTAVVGVGHQGRWHAEKFAALEGSKLVAIVDKDNDRCRSVAEELDASPLENYEDLIGKVDAVSIASPTRSHFDIARALLDNDIHVLVEKPITTTLQEAEALVELAESRGLVLQVGHLERFNPAILALGEILRKPQFIESNRIAPYKPRSTDVSVVLDLMIHDIDLVHSVVGSPVTSLDATGGSIISRDIDIANARIKFENGCVANVTASRASFKTERSLRVFQENAYFNVDLHNKRSTIYRKKGDGPVTSPDGIAVDEESYGASDALMAQSEAFLNSIAGGPPPLVSGRIGMQALKTALDIGEMLKQAQLPAKP
ncbi:MAG: Gfo/Idh/MocA family protein [Woeseia sp.]